MAKKNFIFVLRLQLSDVFWEAPKPESKFSAFISSNGRYLEFQTSAELVEPNESFLTASSLRSRRTWFTATQPRATVL